MQTADHCFSSVVVSQDSGLDKIGLQYSQCGAHSEDAVRKNSLAMRPKQTSVWLKSKYKESFLQ